MSSWARSSAVRYAGPGVFDMPFAVSPYGPKPPVLKPRLSGSPHCDVCRPRQACPDHVNYRVDPLRQVG